MGLHNLTSKKTPTPTPPFLIRAPRTAGSESIKGLWPFSAQMGQVGPVDQSPRDGSHGISSTIAYLVGGWTNPFEKYARQIGLIFPR